MLRTSALRAVLAAATVLLGASASQSAVAGVLYGNYVVGVFSGGIFEEPPGDPQDVISGPDSNYALCYFGLEADIKTESTLNTADLDNVRYYAAMWCNHLLGGEIVEHGRPGVAKAITKVELCEYNTSTRACGNIVSSAGPVSSSSDDAILWAWGEVETAFLTLNPLYAVRATFTLSHPQATFNAIPVFPLINPGTVPCVGGGGAALTCTATSAPFRYFP